MGDLTSAALLQLAGGITQGLLTPTSQTSATAPQAYSATGPFGTTNIQEGSVSQSTPTYGASLLKAANQLGSSAQGFAPTSPFQTPTGLTSATALGSLPTYTTSQTGLKNLLGITGGVDTTTTVGATGLSQDPITQASTYDWLYNQSQVNPETIAAERYAIIEGLQQQERQKAGLDLENRLYQQGRLGSTGGALQQQALQDAIAKQQTQNYLTAFDTGMAAQAQEAAQRAASAQFGIGSEQQAFNQGLAGVGLNLNVQQQAFNQALQNQAMQQSVYQSQASAENQALQNYLNAQQQQYLQNMGLNQNTYNQALQTAQMGLNQLSGVTNAATGALSAGLSPLQLALQQMQTVGNIGPRVSTVDADNSGLRDLFGDVGSWFSDAGAWVEDNITQPLVQNVIDPVNDNILNPIYQPAEDLFNSTEAVLTGGATGSDYLNVATGGLSGLFG